MSSQVKDNTWSDYIAMIRRRWRPTFAAAALLALGTVYVAYSLPAVYQSSATILIEEQGIPTDFVQTTVSAYAEQLLQTIYQRVVASDKMLEMIDRFDLYADERESAEDEDLFTRFRDNTQMAPQNVTSVHSRTGREATITFGFEISFLDSDPVKARNVADELAKRFVSANAELRAQTAARTTAFLDSEAAELQEKLADVAERIADFKEINANNLPEDQDVNLRTWERLRDDLTGIETRLRDAREEKALLEAEIADEPRFRPVLSQSGEPVRGGVDRLAEAQGELMRLRGRYSDDHPAIKNLEREIAGLTGSPTNLASFAQQLRSDLEYRRQELAAALQSKSDIHPEVISLRGTIASLENQIANLDTTAASTARPNNPQYIQLRTRINTAQSEINDLIRRRTELTARVDELENLRITSPQVERRFSALEEERTLLLDRYRELRELEGEAALGEALETGQSGERLKIIEMARVPTSPISPNRGSLSFLGLVLAIAVGLGVASLTDAMDTSVRGRQDVIQLLETPPMGTIPYVENRQDTTRRLGTNAAMGVATIAAIAFVIGSILT